MDDSVKKAMAAVYEADYRAEALRAGLWHDDAQAYATARLADPDVTLAKWRRSRKGVR